MKSFQLQYNLWVKKDHLNLPIRIYTYQTMMKVGTSKIAKYLNLSKSLED